MRAHRLNIVNNERGAVLLTVLIMLVLLSVLGAMSISTSTTEMDLSGNYRREQAAFYNADAGIEYAMTAETVYTNASLYTGTPYTENRTVDDGNSNTTDRTVAIQVEYLTTGAIPEGSGTQQGEGMAAAYFSATATGNGPSSTQTVIEAQYAKLVPK